MTDFMTAVLGYLRERGHSLTTLYDDWRYVVTDAIGRKVAYLEFMPNGKVCIGRLFIHEYVHPYLVVNLADPSSLGAIVGYLDDIKAKSVHISPARPEQFTTHPGSVTEWS